MLGFPTDPTTIKKNLPHLLATDGLISAHDFLMPSSSTPICF